MQESSKGHSPFVGLLNTLALRKALPRELTSTTVQELPDVLVEALIATCKTGNIDALLEDLPYLSVALTLDSELDNIKKHRGDVAKRLFEGLGIPVVHGLLLEPGLQSSLAGHSLSSAESLLAGLDVHPLAGDLHARKALRRLLETADHLTADGLKELKRGPGGQCRCFFWNDGFHASVCHKGEFYVLAADSMFDGTQVVWERIDSVVPPDTTLCDEDFRPVSESAMPGVLRAEAAHGVGNTLREFGFTEKQILRACNAFNIRLGDSVNEATTQELVNYLFENPDEPKSSEGKKAGKKSTDAEFVCPVCRRTFPTAASLEAHQNTKAHFDYGVGTAH
jgi:hypothetical protein